MSTIFPLSASVGQIFDGYEFDGSRWNIIGIDLTADYPEIIDGKISASVIPSQYVTGSSPHTLTNKTIGSSGLLFNSGAQNHSIYAGGNDFSIFGYHDLYLNTDNGDIILQPDGFAYIYSERIATRPWVEENYQPVGSYLTTSSASANYATISYVDTEIANIDALPSQTGNSGKFLTTSGSAASWATIDLSNYLTSSINEQIIITDTTNSTSDTTGALVVSGGVGVGKDLWIHGNLHVDGVTYTLQTQTVATEDNIIYLNSAHDATITNAVYNSGSIVYTAENDYHVGMDIRVTGINPSGFNISTGDNLTIVAANATSFTVIKSDPGSPYVSGGTSHAKSEANADLGFAGGYYSGGYAHAGLFRDASDGIFKFFDGYIPEPDEAVNIDITHPSFSLAPISADSIILSNPVSTQYGGTGLTSIGTANQILRVNSGATGLEWATLDALPSQTGNTGKFLTTNGSTASWANVDALPSQTGNSGKYLTTNGSSASWATLDLSLYATLNSPTLVTPNIGVASGTSLTTTGNVVYHVQILTPSIVSNSYTLNGSEDGCIIMIDNSTTDANLYVPTDATYNFPIGTQITIIQKGNSITTISASSPGITTINYTPGNKTRARYSAATLVKTAANQWMLMGDLTL